MYIYIYIKQHNIFCSHVCLFVYAYLLSVLRSKPSFNILLEINSLKYIPLQYLFQF